MNPFIYGAVILGGMFLLLLYTLYTTHWELLDTRKKSEEWRRKYRHALRRPIFPPHYMQESGLHLLVGEMKSPIYKPFGILNATGSCEVREYSIARGNEIIETNPLPEPIAMCAGDTLNLFIEVRK